MIDRSETVLHDRFGDKKYWLARRSMRYSNELRKIGDDFRQNELNSNDKMDRTEIMQDWTLERVKS